MSSFEGKEYEERVRMRQNYLRLRMKVDRYTSGNFVAIAFPATMYFFSFNGTSLGNSHKIYIYRHIHTFKLSLIFQNVAFDWLNKQIVYS